MESFNDLKYLWQDGDTHGPPEIGEIEAVIGKFNKSKKRNNLLMLAILAIILMLSLYILFFGGFEMWTTYSGIILFTGLALDMIYAKLKRQNKLVARDALPNNEFLVSLEKEETKVCNGKSVGQTIRFTVWAVGFSLYIYEFVFSNVNYLVWGYGALFLLILFAWFIYRPFMSRKFQKDLQKNIDHFRKLKSQVKE